MKASRKVEILQLRLHKSGIELCYHDVYSLRLIEMTLHRWCELKCGTDQGHIESDEKTGKPMFYNARARFVQANDPRAWSIIPDREKGALKRLQAICKRNGLFYFYQRDPRGCALFVSKSELDETNYTNGIAMCD